ncbi:MAG TPA: GNAT family protein [Rhodanobacteraceae bacterium]|nr:GNAT family protein [Rhodanobacteraceae bacterium]
MQRILLRAPGVEDASAFLAAVRASRSLHHPWVAPPASAGQFSAYLARMAQADHAAFLVCRVDNDAIAGVINLSHIVRGVFQSAYLGYYAFADHAQQGFMHAGLRAVTRQAFTRLALHRLEANIQPTNTASIALVKACGFAREGYSPRYLKVAGRWRDHERWALLAR